MKIRVLVSYKDSVLDPQGQTVRNALLTMNYSFVKDVRQGKVFEIETEDLSEEQMKQAAEMNAKGRD